MNTYTDNGLNIESDFEIRILREMGNDIDILIPIDLRVLNLFIENMPDFISNRFQFTEVKNLIIRHTLDEGNTISTIHLLRSIDMNSALVNFTLDYKGKILKIIDKEFNVDMYIESF